ncbi:ASKHA domain-containing protein [Omnitrophica bacterium]|nr:ASKHA domain-containing protein [Candidatus Omnitrophota bacterium]
MDKFKILFKPDDKKVQVKKGANLLYAAVQAGIYIHSSCGGDGVCGRCKVIIKNGKFRTEPTGRITIEEKDKGYVLACLTSVQGDLTVEIPPESRLDLDKVTKEEAKALRLKGLFTPAEEVVQQKGPKERVFEHSPLATKIYLRLPKPDLDDKISDLERLYREIRKTRDIQIMQTGLVNIKRLGSLMRESDWKITATLGKRNETTEIVRIEPGDTSKKNYGMAFDIGTTTITGQLVDMNSKKVLGTKATYNKQVMFGDDVITRIIYATEGGGLEQLHHVVIDTINYMIQDFITEHKINLNDINGITCAGNTTMMHLLLRVDPMYIRREPYVPTANFVPVIRGAEAGVRVSPRGLLYCVPGVSTYVGGDITAGVLACGLSETKKLTLLVDVGTNGEIVIGNREWMAACSASAGPAFEGSGLSCGMRASKGAIQVVKIDPELNVKAETIGGVKPRGICGSGYIDILAELLRHGVITRDGKINTQIKSQRIKKLDRGGAFVVVFRKDAETAHDIAITEEDIENLKRSKGAIYSAISTLLKKLGLDFKDLAKVYLAGGFGTCLNMQNAITIGLLPDLDRKTFSFVGNTSIVGTHQILLSYEAMKKAEEIARKITYIELSVEQGYMDEYMSSLFFPHTDISRFPTVVTK